jgi:XTP/dITP diphosphohydrolase
MSLEIIIASKNRGKIKEILFFFKDNRSIKWSSLADFTDIPEIEETGDTFYENASIKASTVSVLKKKYCLADDSGLSVDHLDGRPGVFSSRYSGENADDAKNREKLLKELEGVGEGKRSARFICSMVISDPSGDIVQTSTGICEGSIGFKEAGNMGFGYDSIFIPSGYDRTMAQLTEAEKNSISHRGEALKGMKDHIYRLSEIN